MGIRIITIQNRKTMEKINKTKNQFFGKINKNDNPFIKLAKKKKETQIKIRNERCDITTDFTGRKIDYEEILQTIVEQQITNNDEMDKFLETH